LTSILEDSLAERTVMHAVLLDILGLGVLIVAESGIGKSECALDLIVRGHRLVADDTVEIRRRAETVLIGTCPELTRHHMELRGVGVINVKDLFGIASTPDVQTRGAWSSGSSAGIRRASTSGFGLDDEFFEVLGLAVPLIRMPVAPGRSIAISGRGRRAQSVARSRGHHAPAAGRQAGPGAFARATPRAGRTMTAMTRRAPSEPQKGGGQEGENGSEG